jgi:putative FmdB family regulatory protein
MPIYEYRCDKCEHEFEAEQRIIEEPLRICPKCRARKLRRLISQTSFVLKGGGWYSDLYSSSKAKPDTSSAESPPAASGDSAAKSDAKPDATDASKGTKDPGPPKGAKGSGKKKSESKKAAA